MKKKPWYFSIYWYMKCQSFPEYVNEDQNNAIDYKIIK